MTTDGEAGGRGALEGARVLVLSTAYRSGPWACRSLSGAGAQVIGVSEGGGRSGACRSPLRLPAPDREPQAFIEAVDALCRRESVDAVLPMSEDATRVVAEHDAPFGTAVTAGPTGAQYRRLCDKGALARAAAEVGVDHPATVVVGDGRDGSELPLPVIVKPQTSAEEVPGGAPATVVATSEERERVVARFVDGGLGAIVQTVVRGRPWVIHAVRGDDYFAMASATVQTIFPRAAGPSSVSTTVPSPPELVAGTRRLLDLVGYVGSCCLNLIEEDGRYWLHDVNLRLGASCAAAIRSGFDQPRLGVQAALGRIRPEDRHIEGRSVTYVRFDGEVIALRHALSGRGDEGPGTVARRIATGLVSPRGILDPSPFDPYWLGALASAAGVRRARRVRLALAGRRA